MGMSAAMGRYRLLRRIGRGGMGEVFLAHRQAARGIEKRVVVKRIRAELAADPRRINSFVREARLSMSLSHRNIVPVFDFGRVEGELFLVMEHVDGRDLGAALARSRHLEQSMSPLLVAYVGVEACEALRYAHALELDDAPGGVVHRDVTPGNVLLSFEGEIKLVDFGLAPELGEGVRGTPAYMAPEQARGHRSDPRTDLFALGLILWEAACGRRAYQTEGDGDAVLELARAGRLPAVAAELPAELARIIELATAADPDHRYQDAAAMQRDLDRYLVAARSDTDEPPSRQLAAWLNELYAAEAHTDEPRAAEAGLITFLGDGRAALDPLGSATLLSRAGTVDDHAPGPAQPEAPPARRRWPIAAGVVAAVALGGAALYLATARADEPAAEVPMVAAAPPPDAAVIPTAPVTPALPPRSGADAAMTADGPPPGDAAPPPRSPGRVNADRSPAPPPAPTSPPGTVLINASPWARVTVLHHDAGCEETPCTLTLPPGRHRIRLHNPVADLSREIVVEVESGAVVRRAESLTRPR